MKPLFKSVVAWASPTYVQRVLSRHKEKGPSWN